MKSCLRCGTISYKLNKSTNEKQSPTIEKRAPSELGTLNTLTNKAMQIYINYRKVQLKPILIETWGWTWRILIVIPPFLLLNLV